MSIETVVLVPVWQEAAYLFSDQERAAVAWAEEVTRVSETHASDDAYAAVSAAFSEKNLVDLTLTIAAMNAINRLGISFRLKRAPRPTRRRVNGDAHAGETLLLWGHGLREMLARSRSTSHAGVPMNSA